MNKRQKIKTYNRYAKSRITHHLVELTKRGLTVKNITFPGEYFTFKALHRYSITHFEIEEIPNVKFGLWLHADNTEWLFAEHDMYMNKFKPAGASYSPCYALSTYDDDGEPIQPDTIDWNAIYDEIVDMVEKPWYILGKTQEDATMFYQDLAHHVYDRVSKLV